MTPRSTAAPSPAQHAPDQVPLNGIQATRLAKMAGVPTRELVGKHVAALRDELAWRIDPERLAFERICGTVVKVDPSTGLKHPVPGATVDVLDIDCDWVWFSPLGWPWTWAFRLGSCEIETLATTISDGCGRFCVWVPRFDIEWVLAWRRERICLPELFHRPTIGDVLTNLARHEERVPAPVEPNPPDPVSLVHLLSEREDVAAAIGDATSHRIMATAARRIVGGPAGSLAEQLDGPAFTQPVPPPLPSDVHRLRGEKSSDGLAARIGVDAARLAQLRLDRYHGPFLRCFDVSLPEWVPFLEVPDITFRVSQDTDGDGDLEVIYEGAFDGPWGVSTQVELDVAPFALSLPTPGCAPAVTCGGEPAIEMIGLMPVEPGYLDPSTGFAVRPNPARASGQESGTPSYPSTAPFTGTLQLYGCAHDVPNATHYRIRAEYAPGDGLSGTTVFGAPHPLVEHWHVFHFAPFIDQVQQPVDLEGWYPILDASWDPAHLLLNWNTGAMGTYRLTLELGHQQAGVVQHLLDAAPVVVMIDNTPPTVALDIVRWREHPSGQWHPLPVDCPVIRRTPGQAVDVQVALNVTAPHLRGVVVSAGGCGGAPPVPSVVEHWHASEVDNSYSDATIYTIPSDAPSGCYGWTVDASSRAFNPDGEFNALGVDFYFDPVYVHIVPSKSVAVVDG